MSKGLKVTLLTVAVALMGMYAMAEAPVIDEIPPVIVGGGTAGSTPPTVFVYPDALDLSDYVSDDGGDAGIVWSYDVVGTALYNINGVDPLGGADPITPGALSINDQVLQSEYDNDSDADTVTIRNVNLSPFPVGSATTDPGTAPGELTESQVVTLWASDGATATQGEVMVYSDNGGPDRLSMEDVDVILDVDYTEGDQGYGSTSLSVPAGGVTISQSAVDGICVEVGADGVYIGTWSSDYDYLELEDNAVYQFRLTVNSNQTTAGLVPLWDIIIDNIGDDGMSGSNTFYYDALFLDNEGGANAAKAPTATFGRNDFECWFMPISIQSATWTDATTGAFSTANDEDNDVRFQYRVLDGDATSGYGGELDLGQICLEQLQVVRYSLDDMQRGTALFSESNLTAANTDASDLAARTSFTFDSGNLTFGPADDTEWALDIASVVPGDGDFADRSDDYPVDWVDNQLLLLEVDLSAPTAGDAASPPDVIQIGFDTPTNELIVLNTITAGGKGLNLLGTPQTGTETFLALYYTHSETLSSAAGVDRIRPRVQVICSDDLNFEGQADNAGDIMMHGWTVTPVTFE
jgi:hypothetical protein